MSNPITPDEVALYLLSSFESLLPEAAPHVQNILNISKDLRPIAVNDRPPQYVIDMREQAFQLSRQRCIEARP